MDSEYKLVWEDNFSGDSLSRADWEFELHETGWVPNELQEYVDSDECAYVDDGKLVIRPIRIINSNATVGFKSARLSSKSFHAFKYGKFEARIKVPSGAGLLPAFRLLPVDEDVYGSWPVCGEIDIMEVVRHVPERVYSTVKYGNPQASTKFHSNITRGELSDDYHVFGCEWLPGKIRFLLDGEAYAEESYWFCHNDETGTDYPYPAPFNKEFFLILTVSVGGMLAGEPDINTFYDDYACMSVDWVKVWQLPEYDKNVVKPRLDIDIREPDESGNLVSMDKSTWEFMKYNTGSAVALRASEADGGDPLEVVINTQNAGVSDYAIQLTHKGIPLTRGKDYVLSFDAMSSEERTIKVAVTNVWLGWHRHLKDTVISLEPHWQTHHVFFRMEDDSNYDARLEFNMGNADSVAQVRLRNIRIREKSRDQDVRRHLAVCGVWEDADNFNSFIRELQIPDIMKDYVITAFSFGINSRVLTPEKINLEFADTLMDYNLGGIIIFAEMLKNRNLVERIIEIGRAKDVPVFALEHSFPGCININIDYSSGFRSLTEHVFDHHGCRDVIMCAGFKNNPFSDERIAVFREVLEAHGIEFSEDMVLYGDFWDHVASEKLDEYLDNHNSYPEAIICANDSMAVGVCDCLSARGISVPEDVIVTGFDGIWVSASHRPGIATCRMDYAHVTAFISAELRKEHFHENEITVEYLVSLDESCGCLPACPEEEFLKMLCHNNQDYFRHSLEMGRFITSVIGMNDMDEAMGNLENYLRLWQSQYYFVAMYAEGGIHELMSMKNGEYSFKQKYYNYPNPVPSMDELVRRDSGFNVILVKNISSHEKSFGFVLNAFERIALREEQRFEEFCHNISAVVNAIVNNRRLLNANADIDNISKLDYLTGLLNRRGFLEQLNELVGNPENKGRILSLFSIDMNGLKMINDNYGHLEGDAAIKILAKSLKTFVGSRGICARYGGDEFAIAIIGDTELLPDYKSIHDGICDYALAQAEVLGKPFPVTASIGIAERIIRDGINIEDIMGSADNAMYVDKQTLSSRSFRH